MLSIKEIEEHLDKLAEGEKIISWVHHNDTCSKFQVVCFNNYDIHGNGGHCVFEQRDISNTLDIDKKLADVIYLRESY